MGMNGDSQWLSIGALSERKSRKGTDYLGGHIQLPGGKFVQVYVFRNRADPDGDPEADANRQAFNVQVNAEDWRALTEDAPGKDYPF